MSFYCVRGKGSKPSNNWIPVRYIALFLICVYCIGCMAIIDVPGALQQAIITTFNIKPLQFSMMFSLAIWPSSFSIINGFIIHRYLGVRLAAIIYVIVFSTGNGLFLFGLFNKNFDLLLLGRLLYGVGADSMMLCMNAFIIHWFGDSNELNMVFAMVTSFPWIGSSFVFFASNRIYEYIEQFYPYLESLGIAVSISVVAFTLIMAASSISLGLMHQPEKLNDKMSSLHLSLNSKLEIPFLFWILTLLASLYFLGVMPFLVMSQGFFVSNYDMSLDTASSMPSAFSFVTCVILSPLGFLVDKTGRNLTFVSLALFLGLISHGIMAFSKSNPFAAVIILSLSYSMMTASYLPILSYLVKKDQTSTAYGIAHSGINSSFAIGSLIAGYTAENYGYEAIERYYFFVTACAVPLLIIIWICNWRSGNVLNLSEKQKFYSEPYISKNLDKKPISVSAQPLGSSIPPALR